MRNPGLFLIAALALLAPLCGCQNSDDATAPAASPGADQTQAGAAAATPSPAPFDPNMTKGPGDK